MNGRILIVEDEESLQELLRINLEMEGFTVETTGNGVQAVDRFASSNWDLVLLDVMLPGQDGFAVCKAIREQNTQVPILMLTARNTGQDRIRGLKQGADDYLGKPFNLEELLLRVRNLIRRRPDSAVQPETGPDRYRLGSHTIHFERYEVEDQSGHRHPLSKKEVDLLRFFIRHHDKAVSRDEILTQVWGYEITPSTRTVDNFVMALRKRFEKDPRHPEYFHSVRGVGYKFTGPSIT